MYLLTKWFGTFLFDKDDKIIKLLFPKDEKEIAKRLNKIANNEILSEEKKIVKDIKDIIVSEKRLMKIGNYLPDDPFFKKVKINPEEYNFSNILIKNATLINSKKETQKDLSSYDLQIVQMVNALDDLIQTSNLLSERIDAWSILPKYKEKIQPLDNVFKSVNKEIKTLEKQIETDMSQIAPNISNLIGPLISARLISHAGSLKKLAKMPASTIQILGAEKALFRFKKEGGKPPKHGVLYQHPYLSRSPKDIRGKISRIIATKIAIAVKADVFTKRDISEDLKKIIKEKINNIKKKKV
jgi:nucleolar protein 56